MFTTEDVKKAIKVDVGTKLLLPVSGELHDAMMHAGLLKDLASEGHKWSYYSEIVMIEEDGQDVEYLLVELRLPPV